jgi:transposase InsO family protein
VLYTDHGTDFTSQHLEQAAADVKMRLIFSTVGKPRGRGKIERFFASLAQVFLCRLPGYAPSQAGRTTLDRNSPAVSLLMMTVTEVLVLIGFASEMTHRAAWAPTSP